MQRHVRGFAKFLVHSCKNSVNVSNYLKLHLNYSCGSCVWTWTPAKFSAVCVVCVVGISVGAHFPLGKPKPPRLAVRVSPCVLLRLSSVLGCSDKIAANGTQHLCVCRVQLWVRHRAFQTHRLDDCGPTLGNRFNSNSNSLPTCICGVLSATSSCPRIIIETCAHLISPVALAQFRTPQTPHSPVTTRFDARWARCHKGGTHTRAHI